MKTPKIVNNDYDETLKYYKNYVFVTNISSFASIERDYNGSYPQDEDPADYYRPIMGVRIA